LVNGVLTISKEPTKVPKAKVEAAKWLILDRMPQIDITDLLAEANIWTDFAHCFTHLRSGEDRRRQTAIARPSRSRTGMVLLLSSPGRHPAGSLNKV
jgi:hypothetical protein